MLKEVWLLRTFPLSSEISKLRAFVSRTKGCLIKFVEFEKLNLWTGKFSETSLYISSVEVYLTIKKKINIMRREDKTFNENTKETSNNI